MITCTTCMSNAQGLTVDAVNTGILLLLGVIVSLLVGFAAFFIYLKRRALQCR
jgi:hypothetical protein